MIAKVGATPVFVDCDLVTRNIDLAQVEGGDHAAHEGDHADALARLARRHGRALRARPAGDGLRVIEDAALVMGSQWKGRNVGAIGDLVTFSFHPNKNMTTIEGGALVVNDAAEAQRVDALRFHGITYRARPHARRRVPGRQVQPARRQRADRRRAARAAAVVPRARGARSSRATSSASRPTRRACCRRAPRDGDGQTWNMFSVLLPLAGDGDLAAAISRRARGRGHRHRRIVRGAPPLHARPPLRLQGRRLSGDRADRARNGDAAAACRHDRRRRRPRLRRRGRGRSRAAVPDGASCSRRRHHGDTATLGRDSRLQRGGEPADAVRAALSRRSTRSARATR